MISSHFLYWAIKTVLKIVQSFVSLILAIAGTVVIFALLYAVVYGLTAKTYYKIAQQEN